MAHARPYLTFNGNCCEAMTFYKECLNAELSMQTIGESAIASQMPGEAHQNIIHARVTRNGETVLLGSDMVGPDGFVKGNTMTLFLECSGEEEIHSLFAKLSAGGQVTFPVSSEFWGGLYGTLTDKFGINWMLSYDKTVQSD